MGLLRRRKHGFFMFSLLCRKPLNDDVKIIMESFFQPVRMGGEWLVREI